MIGIYQDIFLQYLKNSLGSVKVTNKNIIIPCPWCEFGKQKEHYHLHISNEIPIFHCFQSECEKKGTLRKLLTAIEGHDISNKFIDKETLENFKYKRSVFVDETAPSKIHLPNIENNPLKELYLRKRLKFHNIPLDRVRGLIFDVNKFLSINSIPISETLFRMKDYLQTNFIGFLTENKNTVVFRNIDDTQSMRYFKLKVQQSTFVDYYKLNGINKNSNTIVIAEGIFDIFSEHIFDYLNIKEDINLYASALSSKYGPLIQSIVYHEQIFRPKVVILSDRGISLNWYKILKERNRHIIDKLIIYYNKTGKDFNTSPVIPDEYVI
jgi:hypothetical protein